VPANPGERSIAPAPVVASTENRAPHRKARRFRVMNGGMIAFNGMRTTLRAGKEIDETQYDLRMLERQGIILKPLDPPDPVPEAPGFEPAGISPTEIAGPPAIPKSGDFFPHPSQVRSEKAAS
jgi:hypothetical protein